MSVPLLVARALEQGRLQGPASLALSSLWGSVSRPCRPVALPKGAAVIGVGAPTLGGSFKTPLVLALARSLAQGGERIAVVGHGHAGRLRTPRRVSPRDAVEEVGDEALLLCRELDAWGVPVVAGPREGALSLAATLAPRLIVDGLLQTEPERLALSLLVVDGDRPFAARRCPPAGDLRALPARLLEAADTTVRVVRGGAGEGQGLTGMDVRQVIDGAIAPSGARVPLAALESERVGLILAIAHPERVLAALHEHRIFPVAVRTFRDHAVPRVSRLRLAGTVSAWLTTGKCRTKLPGAIGGAPVLVLEHRLELPAGLVAAVREATPRPLQAE